MTYIKQKIRQYPLTVICICIIWVLCFCTMPKTPLDNVRFIDKWVHIAMYAGTCGVMWTEYLRRHKKANIRHLLVFAWFLPVVMSGVIELLQAYCTEGRRSGDWLDFAANSTGATMTFIIGILVARYLAKR